MTFDAVRALAVFLVFVSHSGVLLLLPKGIHDIFDVLRWGQLGVNLFFVLSGFLITRILIRSRGQKNAYKYFLIRRALRIFPVYYITIAAILIAEPGWYLLSCATYTSNYFFVFDTSMNPMVHTWSLCVEEHFYLVWPPIVLFFSLKASRAFAAVVFPVVSIAGAVLTYMYLPEHAKTLFYRGSNYQAFALSGGCALAFIEPWLRATTPRLFKIGIVLFISGLALKWILNHQLQADIFVQRLYSYTLLSMGTTCLFLCINDTRGIFYKACTIRFIVHTGKISYGLYLYHLPVFYFLGAFPPPLQPVPSTLLASAAITYCIATVSFFAIEKPILRFKNRYTHVQHSES